MRKLLITLLLLASPTARAEVVIGMVGPLSGTYQSFGQQMLAGLHAGIDRLNAKGGLAQEHVSLVSADDQCDLSKAEDAAQKLLAAHVDVVIGPFCSNPGLAAAKLFEKAGVPMITPAATLPALTESGLNNVIRLAPRTDRQGAFAAERIKAKRPNAKLALVDDGTADNQAIIKSFLTAYGKGASFTATIVPDQKDFAPLVEKLKSAGIDTIYFATSGADAGRITARAQAAGLDMKRYGADPLLTDAFWEAAGASGNTTLVSFPQDPQFTNDAKALAADLKATGEAADGPTLPAYAAVQLFAAAAEAKGAHVGQAVADDLKSGQPIATILGPLAFDAKGDLTSLRFTWFSWNNGAYQAIAPEN